MSNIASIPYEFFKKIHDSPLQFVLALTGGASRAISDLLETPGASKTILEARVPYTASALDDYLGSKPDQYCSEVTSRALAMASFQRAIQLGGLPEVSVGVGLTASLVSNRPKRGSHRIYAALQTIHTTVMQSIEISKGVRSRIDEEIIATKTVLNLMAQQCKVTELFDLDLSANEMIQIEEFRAPDSWSKLFAGNSKRVLISNPSQDSDQIEPRLGFSRII